MQGCTAAARARRTRGPHSQGPGMDLPWGMVALAPPVAGRAVGPSGRRLGLVAAPQMGVAATGGPTAIRGAAAVGGGGAGGDQ